MKVKDMLAEQGYSTVALPSDDIGALQMLIQNADGVLNRLGSADKITRLFKPEADATPLLVDKDVTVTNITGAFTMASNFEASMGLLETLKQKLGVSLGFAANRTSEDQVVFMFESPKKDAISSFFDLDDFMNQSTLIQNSYSDKLKDNELYIITAVLRSSKFAIGLVQHSNVSAALELPTIKDFVEGHISYGKDKAGTRVIQYEGDKSLVFGVQAVQVLYERSGWDKIFSRKGAFHVIPKEEVVVKSAEDIKVTLLKGQNLKL